MAKELNVESFDTFIASSDKTVLVDFWAPWCGPCRMLSPVLEELEEDHADTLVLAKVNVDENAELAMRYKIVSIPALLVFKNGQLSNKSIGYQPKEDIEELL